MRCYNKATVNMCQRIFLLEGADDNDDAIVGVRTGETIMQVRIQLGAPLCSPSSTRGLTHNFISEDALRGTSLQLEHHGNMKVTVANDERIPCLGVFCGTPFSIDDQAFRADFFVLPLARYDVMLETQ